MDPFAILAGVNTAITVIKSLVALGRDVAPMISDVIAVTSKGKEVTQADLDALRLKSDAWSEELMKPLPPEED